MTAGVHGPRYRRLQRIVVANAIANSATICHRCHNTIDKCRPHRDGKPARWTAGHLHDSQPDITLTIEDLAAECSPCNYQAGATFGNRQRVEPTTRIWR